MSDSCWLTSIAQNYGPLITSGAILFSAAVAVGAMIYNGRMARKRATIDLMLHQREDSRLVEAKKKVRQLHESNTQFLKYALTENSGTAENEAILMVLNNHEFVASGIREGAFEEMTYKRSWCHVLIRDWDALSTFVTEFRKSRQRPTLYKEFEWLATRWKANPLKVTD